MKIKKKLSFWRISLYILFAIILFNWIHKTPEELEEEKKEKIAAYEEFQNGCITYKEIRTSVVEVAKV